MKTAQDLSRIEVMIGNNGSAEAFFARTKGVGQRSNEHPCLSLPVQALSRSSTRAHSCHDNGEQHEGPDASGSNGCIWMVQFVHGGFSFRESEEGPQLSHEFRSRRGVSSFL